MSLVKWIGSHLSLVKWASSHLFLVRWEVIRFLNSHVPDKISWFWHAPCVMRGGCVTSLARWEVSRYSPVSGEMRDELLLTCLWRDERWAWQRHSARHTRHPAGHALPLWPIRYGCLWTQSTSVRPTAAKDNTQTHTNTLSVAATFCIEIPTSTKFKTWYLLLLAQFMSSYKLWGKDYVLVCNP